MFNLIFKFLALWGLVDALWMTTNSHAWSNFWQGRVVAIGESRALSRSFAVLQICFCLWLLGKTR
jgi:hypothetical protein